ncbi:MAG: TIGR02186 family protein [Alphaproteobacteria bacterium]|nr:TIGR02186 family protein [Alphaproteobacteria bacterium]
MIRSSIAKLTAFVMGLCFASSLSHPAMATSVLVADLNEKEVQISTDFNGANLLLFGTIDREISDDVVIIVEGPPRDVAIRLKSRVGGIWINTESATLTNIPSFYQISSTRPLNVITSSKSLEELQLGLNHVPFTLAKGSAISEGVFEDWQAALIRNMEKSKLWNQNSDVSIRKGVLFRSNISLPANVLPGNYQVRILHFRSGELIGETNSIIVVRKSGLSADIFEFAHKYSPAYGIFAILFAVFMGWGAARVFRR